MAGLLPYLAKYSNIEERDSVLSTSQRVVI